MVQHRNISDAERHEAKGASTASNGQVLKANGNGTTTFVTPTDLINVALDDVIVGASMAAQTPSGTDAALQVNFGSAQSGEFASISAGGDITINVEGMYIFDFALNINRSVGSSQAIILTRLLLNGEPITAPIITTLPSTAYNTPLLSSVIISLNADDVVTMEIMRSSEGEDAGGLDTIEGVGGWGDTPSALVNIKKLIGAR